MKEEEMAFPVSLYVIDDTYDDLKADKRNYHQLHQFRVVLRLSGYKMNFAVFLAALFALYCSVEPKKTSPKVVVYSLNPGEFGKENTLICHVTNFHPPDITIELLKNNVVIPAARLTDLGETYTAARSLMDRRPRTSSGNQTCNWLQRTAWVCCRASFCSSFNQLTITVSSVAL
ncbi:hypothetical protein LDENG_00149830 [Lucifuga dentata]|nr:hypothetical protein LDENG_00149830 [Lucifuga dentata]